MARRSWMQNATLAGCAVFALALSGLALSGCGDDGEAEHDDDHGHEADIGPDTGAECPSGSTLTYDTFGQMFMEEYCTRCHSSTLSGNARNGATPGHDFDSLAGIRAVSTHIDQLAGAGPDATNMEMPPVNPKPSQGERAMLSEWLACGAPE